MNKEEFLAELRSCLDGKMAPGDIDSNVDYYRAYIEGEMIKGRSEEEVLSELGPARFIAKTLTANIKDDEDVRAERQRSQSSDGGGYNGGEQDQPYEDPAGRRPSAARRIVAGVIIAIIIILLLLLFGGMFRGIIYLVIRFLPIIVIIALFTWIYRGRGRG